MKYLAVILALLLTACKKDKDRESKIYFTGIVSVDQNGNLISRDDSTDWRFNDVWTKQESNLFTQNYTSNCTTALQQGITAYPNPSNGYIRLYFIKADNTKVAFRLVDENFKVLVSNDTTTAAAIALDITSLHIKDTVRLYYKFIENNCESRGHGDILIQ